MLPLETLTPEQESTLNTEINIKLPSSAVGVILADKGYDKEALRAERCRKVLFRKCKNHHVDRRMRMHCGLPFCIHCAEDAARKRLEVWGPVMKDLADGKYECPKRFTYIEFMPFVDKNGERAQDWLDELGCTLISGPYHGPYLEFFAGYTQDGRAIVRLLFLGETPPEWWGEKFPGSDPQVHVVPMYRIHYFFKECLNLPHIPTDPRDQAEQAILMKGVHKLRFHGIKPDGSIKCEGEYFSVVASDSTEKSEESEGVDKSKKHKCLECGCLLEFASRDYLDEFVPLQKINWERNTDLPAPSPPS